MDNHWLVMILIALAASFLPLQFGVEIFLLGNDDGLKKTSSFVGGITVFRMLVASLMILLPISLFVIRPKQAPADLEKVNTWLNGALGYVVLAVLVLIGLFLMWQGAEGLRNFLAG